MPTRSNLIVISGSVMLAGVMLAASSWSPLATAAPNLQQQVDAYFSAEDRVDIESRIHDKGSPFSVESVQRINTIADRDDAQRGQQQRDGADTRTVDVQSRVLH